MSKIPRPQTLKVPNHALKYTVLYFAVCGGFGLWFKQWHASYLRCGLPKEEWQNYDEDFKRKEDARWNIDRTEIQPDYYKNVSAVQRVKNVWNSLTGSE